MKIVSANYRDRKSKFPWLVRDDNDDPEKAVAFKTVDATKVVFQESSELEQGFGCAIVARCETVEASDDTFVRPSTRDEKALRFDYDRFLYGGGRGTRLDACDTLHLDAKGKMYATFQPPQPASGAAKR